MAVPRQTVPRGGTAPVPEPRGPAGGTEELIGGTLTALEEQEAARAALEARIADPFNPSSGFMVEQDVTDPDGFVTGRETVFSNERFKAAQVSLASINATIERLTGTPPRGGVSTANAQIAAQSQRERLAFDREEAERRQGRAETTEAGITERFGTETSRLQTNTRVDTAIDMLEASISRGEIGRAEADRRLRAAMDAATIQRDVLSDFGGFNLPAGSEFFPNVGPDSAFGNVFQALTGEPFQGLATGGTFGVNPTALAQSVQQAGQGSVLPQLDADIARTRAEIAAQFALANPNSPIPSTPPATQPRISPPAAQNRRLTF